MSVFGNDHWTKLILKELSSSWSLAVLSLIDNSAALPPCLHIAVVLTAYISTYLRVQSILSFDLHLRLCHILGSFELLYPLLETSS